MQQTEIINLLLKKNDGILKTSDVVQSGISKVCFMEYIRKFGLVKVAHGIYMSNDAWIDGMYLLQARFGGVIFSHETALYLLDLTDREPLQYTVTVKTGYNYSGLANEGVKVYSIKKELFETGLTAMESPTGRNLKAYNAERTICDIIRNRRSVEIQDFQTAIKMYTKQKNKDLPLLMRYAKEFRVEKILRQYLEVLL